MCKNNKKNVVQKVQCSLMSILNSLFLFTAFAKSFQLILYGASGEERSNKRFAIIIEEIKVNYYKQKINP